jgi:hypothetical protein
MTHFADPANAGPDARGHLCRDLSRNLSRWLMEPVTPPAPTRTGSAGGADPYLDGGVDLCPGCAAVPLPDPYDLYCPACWAAKEVQP